MNEEMNEEGMEEGGNVKKKKKGLVGKRMGVKRSMDR